MGFLVKASLRKWWKFWVLVGTRAPRPQTQVSPHVGHPACSRGGSLLQEEARPRPRAAVLGNPAVVTRQLLAPPSLTICPSSLPTRVPAQGQGRPLPQMVHERGECRAPQVAPWELAEGSPPPWRLLERRPQEGIWALTSESCLSAWAAGSYSST